MPTLADLLSPDYIATYHQETTNNAIPLLGETLMPIKKQVGLKLAWLKTAGGLPVVLRPSAFDVKAPIRGRLNVTTIQTEMPFFKDSYVIDEVLRQELLLYLQANNNMYKTLMERVYNDTVNLINGADAQLERMRMQVLTTGKIEIVTADAAYQYDYQHPAALKETLIGDAVWTAAATSDPLADFERAANAVSNFGGTVTRAIMNRTTASNLVKSEKLRKAMNPVGWANEFVSTRKALAYIAEELGIFIAVYDKKYVDEAGVTQSFIPDGVVSFIPDGELGNTWLGTTPEEANKTMLEKGGVEVALVKQGIAITSSVSVDPVVAQTKASMVGMPSGERLNEVFMMTVYTA